MKKFKIRYYEISQREEGEGLQIEQQIVIEKEVEADSFFMDNYGICVFTNKSGKSIAAFTGIISVELVK